MIRFGKIALAALTAATLGTPALALAYGNGTPDEQPPAEEQICNPDVGLGGAAYGLCVAYCEANDCELQPDQQACEVLLAKFYRLTGRTDVPCLSIEISDPESPGGIQ